MSENGLTEQGKMRFLIFMVVKGGVRIRGSKVGRSLFGFKFPMAAN
jgi:hypothetical protein